MDPAEERNEHGLELLDAGRLEEAEAAFLSAIELDPDWGTPWYNLGLAHKWRHRWADCVLANRAATELAHRAGEALADSPACWNLGIAATAVGEWPLARWAWRSYGVPIEEGDGPPDGDFGLGFVRIKTGGAGEVVFGRRLDPARLRIECIPFPGSGHRFGDVVLHDGAPTGRRIVGDQRLAVFDELERLEPSTIPTTALEVWCAEPADVEALVADAETVGRAEDWTASVELLCTACSTGDEGVQHEHDRLHTDWAPERRIGLAVPEAEVHPLLRRWNAAAPADRIVRSVATED